MATHSRKKGVHTPRAPIGDVRDPESLYQHLQRFLAWLAERNYSPKTILNREDLLRVFIVWLDERGIRRPQEVTKPIIERYQSHLYVYRKKDGQPLSARTQHGHITPIRACSSGWPSRTSSSTTRPATWICPGWTGACRATC